MTIVYDNNPLDARLRTAWGFACLVEAGEAAILFDTGGDGPTLLANLTALGYDPGDLDIVVLSHVHSDHTGGLDAILEANDHLTVYVPRSFPAEFKERVGGRARLVEVGGPAEIAEHVFTTGELGGSPPEQSLVIQTSRGRIVMTGCAHPGIVEIVRQAKVHGEVYMIVGGFHLGGRSVAEIQAIIGQLRGLGVQRAAPCHCTGEEAIRLFEDEFGPDFVRAGVGAVISVQP
jgi:7,8-dihydropterin-6-yl-methyl-4-(beta-D-ribofuranosyl)aminobenzene 5'-phosphate synthase